MPGWFLILEWITSIIALNEILRLIVIKFWPISTQTNEKLCVISKTVGKSILDINDQNPILGLNCFYWQQLFYNSFGLLNCNYLIVM